MSHISGSEDDFAFAQVNVPYRRHPLVKKSAADHKDLKVRIKQAVNDGEHKAADTAIRLLTKTRDGLQKLLDHVEGHSNKAKAKAEASASKVL